LKITSKIILDALAVKHSQDVFISECKTGASSSGCLRMDAWVMKKSWASPVVTGYEIKVSRSDFLNDTKWQNYLPYCNELYFVCPPKLITIEEVPENVGLMYISSTGTRIYTKKKAAYRDITVPEDLYRYLLMWRTVVTRDNSSDVISKKEYWQNWLEQRELDRTLGRNVSEALKQTIQEKITQVSNKNEDLEKRLERYRYLTDFLESIDVNPKAYSLRGNVERKLEALKALIPDKLTDNIQWTIDRLTSLLEEINKLNKGREDV